MCGLQLRFALRVHIYKREVSCVQGPQHMSQLQEKKKTPQTRNPDTDLWCSELYPTENRSELYGPSPTRSSRDRSRAMRMTIEAGRYGTCR